MVMHPNPFLDQLCVHYKLNIYKNGVFMCKGKKRKTESSDGFEVWNEEWFSLFCCNYAIFVDFFFKKKTSKWEISALRVSIFL